MQGESHLGQFTQGLLVSDVKILPARVTEVIRCLLKNLAASKFDVCREFCVSAKCAAGNITAAAAFSMVQQPFYTLGNIFLAKL